MGFIKTEFVAKTQFLSKKSNISIILELNEFIYPTVLYYYPGQYVFVLIFILLLCYVNRYCLCGSQDDIVVFLYSKQIISAYLKKLWNRKATFKLKLCFNSPMSMRYSS